eukprot:6684961-Prymnesium_polylepis.1
MSVRAAPSVDILVDTCTATASTHTKWIARAVHQPPLPRPARVLIPYVPGGKVSCCRFAPGARILGLGEHDGHGVDVARVRSPLCRECAGARPLQKTGSLARGHTRQT